MPIRLLFVQALIGRSITAEGLLILGRISKEVGLLSIGGLLYFWPIVDTELARLGAIEQ